MLMLDRDEQVSRLAVPTPARRAATFLQQAETSAACVYANVDA